MRCVAIALGMLLAVSATAQAPVFPGSVEMVNITVTVTDTKGKKFLSDLGPSDFVVYDNNTVQKLVICELQLRPIDLVLLVDTSGSMNEFIEQSREAILGLLAILRPEDRLQIQTFDQQIRVFQSWTSDFAAVRTKIKTLTAVGVRTKLRTALYAALREKPPTSDDQERRRVIVLVTDGEDVGSSLSDDDVYREAAHLGTTVYAIQPPARTSINPYDDSVRAARTFLLKIASLTGGTVYQIKAPEDLKGAYARIAQELTLQYRLGYHPHEVGHPGSVRSITVMTSRGVPRYRTSYRID